MKEQCSASTECPISKLCDEITKKIGGIPCVNLEIRRQEILDEFQKLIKENDET